MVTLFASWTLTTHHDESLIKLPVSPIGYNCEDTIAPSFRQATVAEVVRSWCCSYKVIVILVRRVII